MKFLETTLTVLMFALLATIIVTLFTILNVTAGYIVSYIFPLSLFDASLLSSIMAALVVGFICFSQLQTQGEDDEPTSANILRMLESSKDRKRKKTRK